jgi:hypothetical protein
MAMAIKNGLGDAGFDLWREWSMRSIKFDEADSPLQPHGAGWTKAVSMTLPNG